MTAQHPALAAQKLGTLALPNRLAVAPMTRVSATPDGNATTEMADYYATFARGGFGLIITEGIYTDTTHSQGYLNQPGLATDAQGRAWRPVVDAVHAHGVPIIAQLMHAGALSQGNSYGEHTIAPSAITPRGRQLEEYGGSGGWPTPVALTLTGIDTVIAGFVAAAVRARDAGFDGVEVHAANGYLLDQFLTDYTNTRDDRYGGDIVNRVRLTAEVLTAVRAAVGPQFLVGVRLSQTKVNDFTHRWAGGAAEAETIFGVVAGTGVDYLHIASEGRNFLDTARFSDGRTITALARTVSGLPVLANGGMHDLQQAADVLDGGHADLLTLGRGALANPDFPQKVASGADLEAFDHAMLSPMATIGNARSWKAVR